MVFDGDEVKLSKGEIRGLKEEKKLPQQHLVGARVNQQGQAAMSAMVVSVSDDKGGE
jgi:hypothetical protein